MKRAQKARQQKAWDQAVSETVMKAVADAINTRGAAPEHIWHNGKHYFLDKDGRPVWEWMEPREEGE